MSVAVPAPRPPHHRLAAAAANPKMSISRIQARPVQAKPSAPKPPASSSAAASSSKSTAPSPTASTPSPMPPPRARAGSIAAPLSTLAVPGKDMSSSTGRVFAKPSKEWVLPERAKPGRKASTDEPESRRQSQNRLSQRAHRARRTDYITTLEERLRQYEADEIHSNVRLQEVARALKADNEKMKNEITSIRAALQQARSERDQWISERRTLTESVRTLRSQVDALRTATSPATLDERLEYELAALGRSPVATPSINSRNTHTPNTPARSAPTISSTATTSSAHPTVSASTLACPICPDPDPDCPCQQPADTATRLESTLAPGSHTFSSRCGLCDLAPEACICRDSDEDVKPVLPRSPSPGPIGMDDSPDCGLCTSESFCACRAGAAAAAAVAPPVSEPSATALTFASQTHATVAAPAMPLRLRSRPKARQSIWALDNVPAGTSRKEAVCTGDPSNCDACRNDSFGREFCGHLFGKGSCAGCVSGKCGGTGGGNGGGSAVSIASLVTGPIPSPRPSAPASPVMQAPLVLACCGAPELCGHAGSCAGGEVIGIGGPGFGASEDEPEDKRGPTITTASGETMRPNEAWQALKAHPNSKFTPLAILADVVARRMPCEGPRVELSPPPSTAPLPGSSPATHTGRRVSAGSAAHAHEHKAGEKRGIAVETSAVRDALRFLDGATPTSSPVRTLEPETKRRRLWQ